MRSQPPVIFSVVLLVLASSKVLAFAPATQFVRPTATARIKPFLPKNSGCQEQITVHHSSTSALSSSRLDSMIDSMLTLVGLGTGWNRRIALGVGSVFLGIALVKSISIVGVGELGIASTFGTIEKFDPGFHLKYPVITKVKKLSTKTELVEQSNFVPTREGLTVELDTAILIRLNPNGALDLFRSVGPEYMDKVVIPEASSTVRGLTAESEAKALYTSGRSELQTSLKEELSSRLENRGIVVEDVLLKNIVLPETLSNAIQEKARAEQEAARMQFVLQKEQQEAERKAIEAEGIANFQNIVSKGITPSLLKWKAIEATEKIAESPNSKVVIVGNTENSLPVILGGDDKK